MNELLPHCQRCGATPPVFYSRDLPRLDRCERLCAICIRPFMPVGWKPISVPHLLPNPQRRVA